MPHTTTRICASQSLITNLLTISFQSCTLCSVLPYAPLHAKWLLTRPPFWLWSFIRHAPVPYSCALGKAHNIHIVQRRTHALNLYVGVINWTAHICEWHEALQSCCLSWETKAQWFCASSRTWAHAQGYTFLHPALLLTLEKLTQSQRWHYNRSLYIRQWASPRAITSSYALRLLEQDVLRCYWSAALLNVYSSSPSPSLSYHALFDMYSETACILSVCPSYVTTKQNLLVYTHWNVPLLQDGPTSTVPCRRTSKWRGKTDAEHAPKSC